MPFRVDDAEHGHEFAFHHEHDAMRKPLWKSPTHLPSLVANHEQKGILHDAPKGEAHFTHEIFCQFGRHFAFVPIRRLLDVALDFRPDDQPVIHSPKRFTSLASASAHGMAAAGFCWCAARR